MKHCCALLLLLVPLAAAAETVRCNEVSFHELTPARPAETFDVELRGGDIVAVTMRPLSGSLRSVTLALNTPAGVTPAPSVSGGSDGTIRYVAPASGMYEIVTGAGTERQSGQYALSITCGIPRNVGPPRECVREYLVCGQTGRWQLLEDACRFSESDRRTVPYFIHAEKGDEITWEMRSTDFHPRMGLYSRFGELLQRAETDGDRAVLTWKSNATRDLFVYVTSEEETARGAYELTLSCDTSSCLVPVILEQPHDVVVEFGEQAQLSVKVDSKSEITYEWWDAEALPVSVGHARELVTPPVTRPKAYYLYVVTPCGEALSDIIRVTPMRDRRRPRDD
ncbi:MAG TPA: hypothetical protein VJ276_01125 [Thermoanaerobaculia bacterium]|nr:hypothetical protein [Thermoanaerobaculia bacterium]